MIKLIDLIKTLSKIDAFIEDEGTNIVSIYDQEDFRIYYKKTLIWESGSDAPGFNGTNVTGRKLFHDLMLKSPKYLTWHTIQLNEHHLPISIFLKKEVKDIKIQCTLDKHRRTSYYNTDVRPKYCIININLR